MAPPLSGVRGAFALALAVRTLSALLLRTYANPDEAWQGPEVAHSLVFGTGYLTWEWWPVSSLRSTVHPAWIALALWACKLTGLDRPWLVALAPRLQQAALTSVGDACCYAFAAGVYGPGAAARYAALLHVVQHFSLFAGARTFSNTVEWALFAIGLHAWVGVLRAVELAQRKDKGVAPSTLAPYVRGTLLTSVCAALSVLVRPSSALLWGVVGVVSVLHVGALPLLPLAALGIPTAGAVVAASACLDRWLLGRWVLPALSFLRFNSTAELTTLFGVHSGGWYLYAGLPTTAGTLLPLAAVGLAHTSDALGRKLSYAVPVLVGALSLVPHKEHRFLLPLLPLLATYAGRGVEVLGTPTRPALFRAALAVTLLLNVCGGVYLNTFHQRGPVAVAEYLGRVARGGGRGGGGGEPPPGCTTTMAVHWLTPCHAAPYYAVVHEGIPMLQLDCSPGSRVANFPGLFRERVCDESGGRCCDASHLPLQSETGLWGESPSSFLRAMYGPAPAAPSPSCGYNSSDGLFATLPRGWARAVGSGACAAWAQGEGSAYRHLASHAVLYDTDAERPDVAAWLPSAGYTLSATFPYSLIPPPWKWRWSGRGDTDAVQVNVRPPPGGDPSEIRVYVHASVRQMPA